MWFELEDSLPEHMFLFLNVLRNRAEEWTDANPLNSQVYSDWPDRFLVLGLDVCDCERNQVLRTLRVDYDASGLSYGEDETHQFTTALSSNCQDYGNIKRENTEPADLANCAADWLRKQMIRPIELLEWKSGRYSLKRYRMVDSKRTLSWSASNNELRSNLGEPSAVHSVVTLQNTPAAANSDSPNAWENTRE